MEFWTAVAVLRRRWYVFVPTLLIFALLAGILVGSVKPIYKATGTIGVLQIGSPTETPTTTDKDTTDSTARGDNPYARMDSIQFQNVMASYATDPSFKDALVAAGGSPDYTVEPPFGNTPLITLSSSAPTEAQALASYKVLVTQFQNLLLDRQRQVNASESLLLRGDPGPMPQRAFPQNGARTKGVIVVAILGFLVALGLSFLVDSIFAARARRREPDDPPGELVSLIPNPSGRSPLDELAGLDDLDDPDSKAGGSGSQMRW